MSYAHYWEWEYPIVDQELFSRWSADVSLLLQHLPAYGYNGKDPLVIRGFEGTGEPLCNNIEVSFNGDYTGGQDFGHEGFKISLDDLKQPNFFNACATAGKPYDLLVTAALLRFAYRFNSALITSDGNINAWKKASSLCEYVFGKEGAAIPSTIH